LNKKFYRGKHPEGGSRKVIEKVQYNYIRFLYFNKHKSQREIAKEMGIHRATVKRAIKNPEQKYHMNVERDKPVNGDFEKRIKHLLEHNSKQPKNQKLTKRRIYELICEEGYKGSYSSFTYQAREIEEKLGINSHSKC
jgi:DNA-binding transcriptional regulator LsrR (DeoR family)